MGKLILTPERPPLTRTADGSHLPIGRLALGMILFSSAGWIELATEGTTSPLATVVMVGCLLGSLVLLWSAAADFRRTTNQPTGAVRVRSLSAMTALALTSTLTVALAVGLIVTNEPSHAYGSDAAAFNHYNARLVLDGINPYIADSRFWDAVAEFPNAGATPLRRGIYAGSRFGPSSTQLVRDVRFEIAHPARRGPEFDPSSLHSYPALAFIVNAPALWLGFPTTLPVMALGLIGLLVASGWGTPARDRALVWLALLANPVLVLLTLRGSFDVLALLPALLAWQTLERRRLSPLLLGLACAVKQIVWPLVPFYAIIVWRREGPREAMRRLALAGVAFLIPNAPFLFASPGAWARSMFLPVTLPIFPSGIGLVSLARAGVLPLFPSIVYGVFELVALGGLLMWFARAKPVIQPELALILGLLPYLVAWHSATTYFAVIPTLAVYAIVARGRAYPRAAALSGDPLAPGHAVAAESGFTPI